MYQIRLKQYQGSVPVKEEAWAIEDATDRQSREFQKFPCRAICEIDKRDTMTQFWVTVEALADLEGTAALSLELVESGWRKSEYVFFPAAAYNGNRMESRYLPYPPYAAEREGDMWIPVITDIPHLDVKAPSSGMQFLSGDLSTPAMGYFDRERQHGILMFARHREGGRYTGFSMRESKGQAVFAVSNPGVREGHSYFFGELPDGTGFYPTCRLESDDEGASLLAGERLALEVQCYQVKSDSLAEYFQAFHKWRECMERGEDFSNIPFSRAYQAVKEKYIRMNFDEEGYYRVGVGAENPPSFWQAGWVGGGINSFPLLMEDEGVAYGQAKSTIQFIASHLQEDNGWYVPMYAKGKKYGDAFSQEQQYILLVRKAADLLYFMGKQAMYLRWKGESLEEVDASIRAQADAFVRFVGKYGQLGQFLDIRKETLVMGGTASGASAMAALALAYVYLGEKRYLETAEYLGSLYQKEALETGIANGAPGEICQAPDSEAAFGLLEGYVQLYETTGKERWLAAAQDAFELAVTWVMSYDFTFPSGRTAAKLKAHTRGTVFANVQNKHSAPGICTLSGNSMLKLYRFTGDRKYLEWMRRISHALPQFVSLKERPVDTLEGTPLPWGYFNERVQTSDWEGKHTVGEFLGGSNWPEVSMLLTYVEIPGIYLDLDRGQLVVSDHMEAEVSQKGSAEIVLRVKNPTPYDARVTFMADHSKSHKALGHLYFPEMDKLEIKAGQTAEIIIKEAMKHE